MLNRLDVCPDLVIKYKYLLMHFLWKHCHGAGFPEHPVLCFAVSPPFVALLRLTWGNPLQSVVHQFTFKSHCCFSPVPDNSQCHGLFQCLRIFVFLSPEDYQLPAFAAAFSFISLHIVSRDLLFLAFYIYFGGCLLLCLTHCWVLNFYWLKCGFTVCCVLVPASNWQWLHTLHQEPQ